MSVECSSTVLASTDPSIFILGTREEAAPLRQRVELELDRTDMTVCVDFCGVTATQSFADEFIGVLILRRGPVVLERLAFRNCSEEVRAIIRFVASSRIKDYNDRLVSAAH